MPRLILPCSQAGDDLGGQQFRRQINVALGRSHSQRTPRRDVSFRVEQGVRLEKQHRPQLFASSSARSKPSDGGVEVDAMLSSSRYVSISMHAEKKPLEEGQVLAEKTCYPVPVCSHLYSGTLALLLYQ